MTTKPHPAKFTAQHMEMIQRTLDGCGMTPGARILDPFAGVGMIHQLTGYRTDGVEIEPEWAEQHENTRIGDALDLPWRRGTFQAIVTSPCFGNRMADHHNARDASVRNTYKHTLGRDLDPLSAARLQWGAAYQEFHLKAIIEATRVCKKPTEHRDVWWVLNISDHYRPYPKIMPVSAWWISTLTDYGWMWVASEAVTTPRQRQGANGHLRVDNEWMLTFRRIIG